MTPCIPWLHGTLTRIPSARIVAGTSITSEFKRVWTHSAHRRRGLARFVLAELEALAARRGYRKVYLTTGPRQPEAKHLYLNTGYEAQFDLAADPETIGPLAFTKDLPAPSR